MLKKLLTTNIYIKVYKNKFEAKNLSMASAWQTQASQQPFTTERLLVGNFTVAESILSSLIKVVLPKGVFKKCPQIVIHPMVMTEGGLSEVEERIFTELAAGTGACKVVLHIGSELSNTEAIKLLNNG